MSRRRPTRVRHRSRPRAFGVEGLEGRQMLAASVAVGSDVGPTSTPLVRLVDAESGEVRASVLAFEAGFKGGVRVAMGRVTGNAAADVVVASGSGRVTEVKVFRPVPSGATTTLTQVLSFRPFGDSYLGGCEVAVGNVDGIDSEDIVVSKSREGGDVKVFRVTNTGGTTSVALHATIAKPFGAAYNGGSSVGVADVGTFANGALVNTTTLAGDKVVDGKGEIAIGSGPGIEARVLVYDISLPSAPRLADSFKPAFTAAYGRPFVGGVAVSAGRFNADFVEDIFVSAGRGGSGSAQTIVYDGTVAAAANAVLRQFATYGAGQRPNAAVFTAAVDTSGDGQIDRFLVTQGDPGGPTGIATVSSAGTKGDSLGRETFSGPLRIAAARPFVTMTAVVNTPSPALSVAAGSTRNMQFRDEVLGTGAVATNGKTLRVNYTGTLTNGTKFDSSRDPGRTPFEFTLGAGDVIKGWDAGLAGMKVGGRRLLVIPMELAYGDAARPNIPANSTLLFDVELLSVT